MAAASYLVGERIYSKSRINKIEGTAAAPMVFFDCENLSLHCAAH
jgi:hypothetical protein